MDSIISFGEFNYKKNKFIIFLILSLLAKDHFFGFNYNDSLHDLRLITEGNQKNISNHIMIHQFFCYLGTLIIAIICFLIEKKSIKKETAKVTKKRPIIPENSNEDSLSQDLIEHENKIIDYSKFPLKKFLIITFLWILSEQIINNLYSNILKDLDFWMIEIIILSLLNYKIYGEKLYNFQKLVIFLNLIPIVFKITTIIFSFFDKNNYESPNGNYHYENGNLKIIYVVKYYLVPIGFLVYLVLITTRSSVNLALKRFMDKLYISQFFLLMNYGLMGTIICMIVCIISTYLKCVEGIEIKEGFNYGYDYICRVQEPYSNSTKVNKYFENFKIYSSNFRTIGDIAIEIIIVLLKIIFFFFQKCFSLKIIKYLSPTHVIFSIPIYYFCQKSLAILKTLIDEGRIISKKQINFINVKLSLDIAGDILAFIGFLIYLEIIELKFAGFDYNLRKNIEERLKEEQIENYNLEKIFKTEEENMEENER